VLRNVNLTVSPGGTAAVVGPSGSGKSTLLNIIGSLDAPTSGTVRLGEVDIASLEGAELSSFRSRKVGFVFQDHHLLPQCTALENVMLPTLAADGAEQDAERGRYLLERVGLEGKSDSRPANLSGGERQRVAIARAMINSPRMLLCDEPTGNVDTETGNEIMSLLRDANNRGNAVLLVTHERRIAEHADRVVNVTDGVIERIEQVDHDTPVAGGQR